MSHLSDTQIGELRALLIDMMSRAQDEIRRLGEHPSGSFSADLMDRATDAETAHIASSRIRILIAQIAEIRAALRRIDDGEYGYCEETGAPIPYERLRVVPTARCSIEGEEAREARMRREGPPTFDGAMLP